MDKKQDLPKIENSALIDMRFTHAAAKGPMPSGAKCEAPINRK